jgi:PBSX family phage terminase large subunit
MSLKKNNGLKDIIDDVVPNNPVYNSRVASKLAGMIKKPEVPVPVPTIIPKKSSEFTKGKAGIYTIEVGDTCPRCNYGKIQECISFSEKSSEFFVKCADCNAYIHRYKPMPHQEMFHKDQHAKRLYAGGFGSAKTFTGGNEFLATVLQIPQSVALVGAATWSQVYDTALKFIIDNIPKDLVAHSNQDKVNWNITLINGSTITAKALDKEGKIRSANLSLIWVEEASEVDYSVIAYIAARLRNNVAYFKGKNRLKMILTSNPDVGWLNDKWLMVSDKIYYHGDVPERYEVNEGNKEPSVSTHISTTDCNIYLPPNYVHDLSLNKPEWWVNRYLKGSFKYAEGLVYPEFTSWVVSPFEIPKHWQRIAGIDFGRRDPTAYVLGAIEPNTKVIYVYKEVYMPLNDEDVQKVADEIKQAEKDIPEYLFLYPRQGDPRGVNRDQISGENWYEAYLKRGLFIEPASDMRANSIAPSIAKLYSYGKAGKIKFFANLKNTLNEFKSYKYPNRNLGEEGNQGETPIDSHNHLPDAIRYMMSKLPAIPGDINLYRDIFEESLRQTAKVYNPLSTNNDDREDGYVDGIFDDFL